MKEGLSFSDIFDEDIPYEQKPPMMFTPMEEGDDSLLTETHLQDLFHATHETHLYKILHSNALKLSFTGKNSTEEFLSKGYPFFLSTMRQKYGNYAHDIGGRFVGNKYNVIIHLDGITLQSNGFKHFPLDYWGQGPEYSEQEERIVSHKDSITPLKKFVKGIHVYIGKDLSHPFVIDNLHKSSDLAAELGVNIYFYPHTAVNHFRSQRTEKAVKDVSQILPPAEFSKEDLEWQENRKKYVEEKDTYLDSFMRIYNKDYSQTDKHPDKSVLNWLRYYHHDAYASLSAAAHNHAPNHLPIFREIVKAMKKEGVKKFKDLITLVIQREDIRLRKERDAENLKEFIILKESDELIVNYTKYNNLSTQSVVVFEVYPSFWVYARTTKNGMSTFRSNNRELELELQKSDNKYKVQQHARIWFMLEKLKNHVNIPKISYVEGEKKSNISGRIWGIQGNIYVSFWEELEEVKFNWNQVEDILSSLSFDGRQLDIKKCLYIFGGKSEAEDSLTYDQIIGGEGDIRGNEHDIILRRLIHLNPEIKRSLLQPGNDKIKDLADKLKITPIQLRQMLGQLDEADRALEPSTSKKAGWEKAESIFIVYDDNLVVGMKETPNKIEYYSNIPQVQKALNIPDFTKFMRNPELRTYQLTHAHLTGLVKSAVRRAGISTPVEDSKYQGMLAGRIWKFQGDYDVVGVWQGMGSLKRYWKLVQFILEKLNVDWRTAKYTVENKWRKQYYYSDIHKDKPPESSKVNNVELALQKILHLNPFAKRAMIHAGPNELQVYADRMNISVAELKQILGNMD